MARTVRDLVVALKLDSDALDRKLRVSKKRFGEFARSSSGGFGRVARSAAAMGAALGAAFSAGAKGAAQFDASFSRFAARTGGDVALLRQTYGAAVDEISRQTGVATDTIVDGFQRAVSAGASGRQAIDLVALAAKAEAAEVTKLGDAVDSATALHSAFGAVAGTLSEKLDAVTAAAQVGKGDSAAFAQALAQAAPLASNLGLSLDYTAGAMAAISANAASVPQGATQFIAFLNAIVKPTAQAEKVLETLGESIGRIGYDGAAVRQRIREGGLVEVLREFQTLDQGALGRLLGGAEALNFVAGVDPDSLSELAARIEASLGHATETAFGQGADDLTRRLAQIARVWETSMRRANEGAVGAIDTAVTNIGGWDALANTFTLIAGTLRELVHWLVRAALFAVEFRHAIAWTAGGVVAVLAFGAAWHTLARGVWALQRAWLAVSRLRTARFWKNLVPKALVAAKILAVVAAVAAVGYAASVLIRAWEPVKAYFAAVWDGIKAGATVVGLAVRNAFLKARDVVLGALSQLAAHVNTILDRVNLGLLILGKKQFTFRLPTVDDEAQEAAQTARKDELRRAVDAFNAARIDAHVAQASLVDEVVDLVQGDWERLRNFSVADFLRSGIPTATPATGGYDYDALGLPNRTHHLPTPPTPEPPKPNAPEPAVPDFEPPAETAAASLSDALRRAFRHGDLSDVARTAWESFRSSLLDTFFDNFESALGALFDKDPKTGFLSTLLNFDAGGTVPGPEGRPRLAVVHGGEVVMTPAQQRGQGGGVTINQSIATTGDLDERVMRTLQKRGYEVAAIVSAALR